MLVVDKRPTPIEKNFDELPVGAVFEFPDGGIYMKINVEGIEETAIDIEGYFMCYVSPSDLVIELNAYLTVEG